MDITSNKVNSRAFLDELDKSYKVSPRAFLDELDKVDRNQLPGSQSSALAPLLQFLKDKGIIISELGSGVAAVNHEALLTKMLAYFMPADAAVQGGHYDSQIKGGIVHLKAMLTSAVAGNPAANPPVPPKTTWSLNEFMALAHFSLTGDRVDDDIIGVMQDTMSKHTSRRDKIKGEVGSLTAELRVYSIIQSEISKAQAGNGRVDLGRNSVNIFDFSLYGYASHAEFVRKDANGNYNPQYQLLREIAFDVKQHDNRNGNILTWGAGQLGMTVAQYTAKLDSELAALRNDQPTFLSMRDFLVSQKKDTGAMANVAGEYEYNKDNNKLGNFATSVSDRAKPLNDKLSQKTTELNDISSRYNSAIEAMNRFISKYESMMQQILQAI